MTTLFVAWQDPKQRAWYPVGRLTGTSSLFQFVYTNGAVDAREKSNFGTLPSFDSFEEVYESDELFPLFANRVPPQSRPDYVAFAEYLNLPGDEYDPIAMLAISGGRRATDALELFPCPEPDSTGDYHIRFFAHGLRYFPDESAARIDKLEVGEQLLLLIDFQNPFDANALLLRTDNSSSYGGRILVGYVPRYLLPETWNLLRSPGDTVRVTVERINRSPAPLQVRLLCNLSTRWPEGYRPFSGKEYQPIAMAK